MTVHVGTSGYSYKEWKGSFYPEGLAAKDMLSYYGQRLSAVEINNTFYRLPKASVLENWAAQVPDGFRFSLKASRRITHFKRLEGAEEETDYLLETARTLGDKLGVVLFQLPPHLRKDTQRLQAFVERLPDDVRAAFEFRHASWQDDEVLAALQASGCALCLADTEDAPEPELTATAAFGYLRLRRPDYTDADLLRWAERVQAADWSDTFVFFKHEDAGTGPRLAARFAALAGAS